MNDQTDPRHTGAVTDIDCRDKAAKIARKLPKHRESGWLILEYARQMYDGFVMPPSPEEVEQAERAPPLD